MSATANIDQLMTAEEFVVWVDSLPDGERYELVDGRVSRLQSERIGHAEIKASVWLALRAALRKSGRTDCRAFVDGVGIRIASDLVREPDALIHCGPYEGSDLFARNPVIVVEVVSPNSGSMDRERKLIDYFSVPSIRHYLIVLGTERRVIHHSAELDASEIATRILGPDAILTLDPPGIEVSVAEFFVDLPELG